ncbi:MAG: GAF domain-containing protein [Candidatus Zixiibacteriota bacterium]
MEKSAISVLAALNTAVNRAEASEKIFAAVVEAIVENLEVEAALLEVSGGAGEAQPQIFEAGSDDSRRLLKRLTGERLQKLFDLFQGTIGFQADKASFSIRRDPPTALKVFKILSEGERVGQLSLLVKDETAPAKSLEEFASFLSSQLGLLWPMIHGAKVRKPAQPSLYEQFQNVGLDSRKLLLSLLEQVKERLKPELILLAFAPDSQEYLRTLVLPETLLQENPLLSALPAADTSFGEVLSTRRPLLRSYPKETISRIDDKLFADIGLSSGVIVPVFSREKVVALLFVGSKTIEEFVEDDAGHLEYLGREVGEIIDNVVTFVSLRDEFEDLKRRYQDAVMSEKMQSIVETAVTINHEINNPLMAILGNTQLLLLKSESLEPGLLEKLKLIEQSCLRIQKVTQKLMAMAEPKATFYTNGRRMVDIAESVPSEDESW